MICVLRVLKLSWRLMGWYRNLVCFVQLFCRYEYYYALMRDFPDLTFTINGGINSLEEVKFPCSFFCGWIIVLVHLFLFLHVMGWWVGGFVDWCSQQLWLYDALRPYDMLSILSLLSVLNTIFFFWRYPTSRSGHFFACCLFFRFIGECSS